MKIKVWKDPYDTGSTLTSTREIELKQGLSVIAGCNGSGKTTLIQNIKEELTESKVPCLLFDNLQDGQSSAIGALITGYKQFECDSMEVGASLWTASEGEAIKINIGRQSTLYREFIETGKFKDDKYRFAMIFKEKEEEITDIRRVFLFDAADSGLSIDSICELKELFEKIIEEAKFYGKEIYIIITANEYELCRGEECIDVTTGKYRRFRNYEDYRKFILQTREKKNSRLKKEVVYRHKVYEKEKKKYQELKKETEEKSEAIQEKARSKNRGITWKERCEIENLKDRLKDYLRKTRFFKEEE